MAKKLQRRKTRHQQITSKNPVHQSIIESKQSREIVSPVNRISSKTSSAMPGVDSHQYVKGDLIRSLIVGAAMFALMVFLFFVIR